MTDSVPQFPPSLNLAEQKDSLAGGIESFLTRYPASNSTYSPSETSIITIGTGGRSTFLYGDESYLSFAFTPTFSGNGTGSMYLDGSAFSLLQRVTLYHGSNELFSINTAGRLWQAIYDCQNQGGSFSGNIDHGVSTGFAVDGIEIDSGSKYYFCLPLLCPLIGSLSDKALPLGWAQASGELRLEIQWAPYTQCVTNTASTDIDAVVTAATALPVFTTYSISDVYFNTKISRLSPDLNQMLLMAFKDRPISIASTDYRAETTALPANQTLLTTRLAFNFKSLKAILWWTLNQQDAGGALRTNAKPRASSSRFAGGELKKFYVQIDGQDSLHIDCDRRGATLGGVGSKAQDFVSPVCYNALKQVFNGVGSGLQQSVFGKAQYGTSLSAGTDQALIAGKFIGAIDLERSNSSSVAFSGVDVKNSNVSLNIEYTARSDAAIVYIFGMCDVIHSLVNGSFVRSD